MLKLHLDTDIGGDIDDLCALAMVLNWQDTELLAVTTVAEHQGKRAGYVRYALGLAGREETAVASGADASLGCYRSWPYLPDEDAYWPEPIPPAPTALERALDLLERSIEQGAIIAAIGPYTNLALLEKRSPGILRDARLYLMGGYVFPPREGFPRRDSQTDYNAQVDVESAHLVIENSNPTLVPLAVTVETALRRAYVTTLRGQVHSLNSSRDRPRHTQRTRTTKPCMVRRARVCRKTSLISSTTGSLAQSRRAGMKAWRLVKSL